MCSVLDQKFVVFLIILGKQLACQLSLVVQALLSFLYSDEGLYLDFIYKIYIWNQNSLTHSFVHLTNLLPPNTVTMATHPQKVQTIGIWSDNDWSK